MIKKVGIIGSRSFVNTMDGYKIIKKIQDKMKFSTIISGGARGADTIAKKYAREFGLKYIEFPADWNKYGKKAGFLRNVDIVRNSDLILAFWDGVSRGTLHSIRIADKLKRPLIIEYV